MPCYFPCALIKRLPGETLQVGQSFGATTASRKRPSWQETGGEGGANVNNELRVVFLIVKYYGSPTSEQQVGDDPGVRTT